MKKNEEIIEMCRYLEEIPLRYSQTPFKDLPLILPPKADVQRLQKAVQEILARWKDYEAYKLARKYD